MNNEQIEAAAKAIAACMDYPWEHMPEQGRETMRQHAKSIIEAAGLCAPADVLKGVDELVREAYAHWDADRGSKVGKILLALIGHNKGYDKRADAWRAAIGGAT